jgi:enamine deaminase RidA (YjgF/YER057c/UK114 family)
VGAACVSTNPEGVAPPPGEVFSHAVVAGDTVYASGQVGVVPSDLLLDGSKPKPVRLSRSYRSSCMLPVLS